MTWITNLEAVNQLNLKNQIIPRPNTKKIKDKIPKKAVDFNKIFSLSRSLSLDFKKTMIPIIAN